MNTGWGRNEAPVVSPECPSAQWGIGCPEGRQGAGINTWPANVIAARCLPFSPTSRVSLGRGFTSLGLYYFYLIRLTL